MLLSALSVSPLFGDSVHRMRSIFSGYYEGAAIFRAVSPPKEDGSSSLAQSPHTLDPKRDRAREAVLCATLGLLVCQDLHLLFSVFLLSCLLPLLLLASVGVVERIVDLCCNPQAVQEHRESFLATATAARFFAFFPPREAIFSP